MDQFKIKNGVIELHGKYSVEDMEFLLETLKHVNKIPNELIKYTSDEDLSTDISACIIPKAETDDPNILLKEIEEYIDSNGKSIENALIDGSSYTFLPYKLKIRLAGNTCEFFSGSVLTILKGKRYKLDKESDIDALIEIYNRIIKRSNELFNK